MRMLHASTCATCSWRCCMRTRLARWRADHPVLCAHPSRCMHLFRDTSPVLLATGGASLSLIELHCR
jgi:hypothetical protein